MEEHSNEQRNPPLAASGSVRFCLQRSGVSTRHSLKWQLDGQQSGCKTGSTSGTPDRTKKNAGTTMMVLVLGYASILINVLKIRRGTSLQQRFAADGAGHPGPPASSCCESRPSGRGPSPQSGSGIGEPISHHGLLRLGGQGPPIPSTIPAEEALDRDVRHLASAHGQASCIPVLLRFKDSERILVERLHGVAQTRPWRLVLRPEEGVVVLPARPCVSA